MADALAIPDLAGRAVLITGASTGIGAALARAFAGQGAQVAIHYNSSRIAAEALSAEIGRGAAAFGGDLTRRGVAATLVDAVVARFGRLDILINNAGSLVGRRPIDAADDAFSDAVVDLNIRSAFEASRAAIPALRAQGGAIISTSSIAARNGGAGGVVLYAAAKAFISTFTRGLAKELVKDNIRVNAVAPGVIATALHERHSSAAQMAAMVATIPMGRAGVPQDCIGAYLFLASPALSGYVTGQVIEVNGGQYMS
jgi:3-oxoacyl-[acyl-carrier protein] reductase